MKVRGESTNLLRLVAECGNNDRATSIITEVTDIWLKRSQLQTSEV